MLLDIYRRALGMLSGTPLGEAATERMRRDQKQAAENGIARAAGNLDGQDGERRCAGKYPSGAPGHADYEMGYAEGLETRREIEALNQPAA